MAGRPAPSNHSERVNFPYTATLSDALDVERVEIESSTRYRIRTALSRFGLSLAFTLNFDFGNGDIDMPTRNPASPPDRRKNPARKKDRRGSKPDGEPSAPRQPVTKPKPAKT